MRGSGEDNLLLFWMVRSMTLHIPQDGCHVGKIEKRGKERGALSRRRGEKEKEKDGIVIKDGKRYVGGRGKEYERR